MNIFEDCPGQKNINLIHSNSAMYTIISDELMLKNDLSIFYFYFFIFLLYFKNTFGTFSEGCI